MKVSVTIAALAALIAPAVAADLPARTPAPAVFVQETIAPSYSWTGLYAGLNVGYVPNSTVDYTHRVNSNLGGVGGTYSNDVDGWTGGAHVGYNQQFGMLVVGIEGSASYANVKGNYDFAQYWNNTTTKVTSLFTVTPRIGLSFLGDRALVYVKGGWAGGNLEAGQTYTPPKFAGLSWSASDFHNGWTIGGGGEYALTRNWSVGLEYNYIRLNDVTHSAADSSGKFTAISAAPKLHEIRSNVNFKF